MEDWEWEGEGKGEERAEDTSEFFNFGQHHVLYSLKKKNTNTNTMN